MRSGALTLPGFCHDRYATNVGLFATSPVYRELKTDFDAAGVRLLRSERTYASIHGSAWCVSIRIANALYATLSRFNIRMLRGWKQARCVLPSRRPEIPSDVLYRIAVSSDVAETARIASVGRRDAIRLANLTRQTSLGFASGFFQSAEMRGVIESWGYHLDFGPNVRGGATFAFVAAMSAHINGMPIVEGGAGRISEAMRTMVETAWRTNIMTDYRGGSYRRQGRPCLCGSYKQWRARSSRATPCSQRHGPKFVRQALIAERYRRTFS